MPQALKTLRVIHFCGWKNSLFPLMALWGNKNLPPSMKVSEVENCENIVSTFKSLVGNEVKERTSALVAASPSAPRVLRHAAATPHTRLRNVGKKASA